LVDFRCKDISPTRFNQRLFEMFQFSSQYFNYDDVVINRGLILFQGPVLVITFLSQQIMSVRDAKGVVVEGDPEKVLRVMYVWVLCRDQTELDPKAAWRLLELSANSTEQFL
jgi:import inner membrane translocase subunit TIM44